MFDLTPILEFSRTHCVTICAFLVPLNLLATLQTMVLTALRRPPLQISLAVGLASAFAVTMILHVATWLVIGVVMAPTFILLGLGSLCLAINLGAIAFRESIGNLRLVLQEFPRVN
jgi:hypothetical protein